MSLFESSRTIHKWLSLLVGIQLLIWLVTGIYFNLMDHHKASGHEYRVHSHNEESFSAFELVPISLINSDNNAGAFRIMSAANKPVESQMPIRVNLIWVLGHPYYHFVYQAGQHSYQKSDSELFDAVSGKPFKLAPSQALVIAERSYSGPGKVLQPTLEVPPFDDYVAQQNPMWKVVVKDDNETTIYLDAVTGEVLRHANSDFRLKELMMKLHFMDYGNSSGFNHWWIVVFALLTLLLSITGVIWLVQPYLKRRMRKQA